jgi:hypothetical protein
LQIRCTAAICNPSFSYKIKANIHQFVRFFFCLTIHNKLLKNYNISRDIIEQLWITVVLPKSPLYFETISTHLSVLFEILYFHEQTFLSHYEHQSLSFCFWRIQLYHIGLTDLTNIQCHADTCQADYPSMHRLFH